MKKITLFTIFAFALIGLSSIYVYNKDFKSIHYTVEVQYEFDSNLSATENRKLRDEIKEKLVAEMKKDNIEITYNVSQTGVFVVEAIKKEIEKYKNHKYIETISKNHGYGIEGL